MALATGTRVPLLASLYFELTLTEDTRYTTEKKKATLDLAGWDCDHRTPTWEEKWGGRRREISGM